MKREKKVIGSIRLLIFSFSFLISMDGRRKTETRAKSDNCGRRKSGRERERNPESFLTCKIENEKQNKQKYV